VAETLQARGTTVGKFIPIVDHPLPPKPVDIAENKDSRKDYRRRAAEVMNRNAASFKKSCRTRMTMEAVKVFKNKPFFLPWSLDYRGRAYPIPAFLTPQDTDFGKSLLMFDEPAFMTYEAEDWLRFQVATTRGLDKAPIAERLQWAKDNEKLIEQIATDPLGMICEWEVADEPWQFLAACREYYEVMIACTKQSTCLMVATDATCSGIQILSGLARDKSAATLVNVVPGDEPQDAYKVVAESAKPHIHTPVKDWIDRKVTKKTVMTVPYNSKPFSNRSYIRDALKEKGYEIEKEELTELVNQVRAAMYRELPGPMKVMDWIEEQVSVALADGRNELTWTTPSGFVVTQKLMKKDIEVVSLQLMGRCKISIASDSQEVDRQHHKNATSPNLIHSLDASLLHLSAIRFNAPLALIHDSVLCRATDMACLSAIVRETYMHLFAEHDYLVDWAEQIGATTPPPIVGDLMPESVIESTYFFC
jgi:DNA-directed RNA polymerase